MNYRAYFLAGVLLACLLLAAGAIVAGTHSFDDRDGAAQVVMDDNLDLDGHNLLLDQDGDSYIEGDRSATVADDTYVLRLGGSSMLSYTVEGLALEGIELTSTDSDSYAMKLDYTCNIIAGAPVCHGLRINMTDTASPGANYPLWVGNGGASTLMSDNAGHVYSTGNFNGVGANLTGNLSLTGGGSVVSTSDGNITIAPNGSGNTIINSGTGYLDIRDNTYIGDGTYAFGHSPMLGVEGVFEVQGWSYLGSLGHGSMYNTAATGYDSVGPLDDTGSHLMFNASQTQLGWFLGSALGNQFLFGLAGYRGSDYGHGLQVDPTLFSHSVTDPDSDNREYLALTHNQSASEFRTGKGYHYFTAAVLAANGQIIFTGQPSANDAFTINATQFVADTDFAIGATLADTLDAAVVAINAAEGATVSVINHLDTTIVIEHDTPGVAGNAVVLTEDVDAGAVFSVTGAGTLTLGRDAVTGTPAAGTNSYFPGVVEMEGAYFIPPRLIAAAPSEPVACGAAYEGASVYVDDTDDTAWGRVCICANLDGTGYDWRDLSDITGTACPFF